MQSALPYLVGSVELMLAFAGAVLLWRLALSPAAREKARVNPAPLAPWNVPVSSFLTFLLFVVGGGFIFALAGGLAGKSLGFRGDAATVFNGTAAQLGMLAGIAAYHASVEKSALGFLNARIALSGLVTFLVTLPVLMLTAKAWEFLLQLCGLPVDRQDLIGMFANADSPAMLVIMIALAVIIAPVTEEMFFRAGLFRFFRTRIPRWAALLGPALIFASLHVNWQTFQGLSSFAPLAVLAMMFSLGYERTGRIGTSIVAHALFNLNTVLLIFAGVGT